MVERAILESNVCCTEGPMPPVEKDGICLLSLFHESEKVLSQCLFGDLLGTVDNSRYRRSVGVSCPSIFRSLTSFKSLLSTF